MNFFVVSAGEPDKDYVKANFKRILENNSFNLYEQTSQKGALHLVEKGDILIVKYFDQLVCYGKVKKHRKTIDEEFNLWIDVDNWIFYNNDDKTLGVSKTGVGKATLDGGPYGTIKLVKSDYALKKIDKINNNNKLYEFISKHHMLTKENLKKTKIEKLLRQKSQIILQGPPGTGKTKLAKEIAEEITSNNKIKSIKTKIEYFFENHKLFKEDALKKRQNIENELLLFKQKFPQEKIKDLSLEDYTLGQEDRDGFCYWLEYKLVHTGKYNGQARKFKIYYNQETDSYEKSKEFADKSDLETMQIVANRIQSVVDEPLKHGKDIDLGKGFVLKILNTYKPDQFFPINSESIIDQFLNALSISIKGKNYLKKNIEVQNYFEKKKNEYNIDVTNFELMHYLFNNDILNEEGNTLIFEDNFEDFKIVQFHPSYTYEDFVRGISVESKNNNVEYNVNNRVLAELANTASINPKNDYVLIIDEINRANLPSVFGELIYAMEYRGEKVESMYKIRGKGRELILPKNLYIIGTMNTADRSVGHLDYAIRRRFGFIEILPEDISGSLEEKYNFATEEFKKVKSLFINEGTDWERSVYLSNEFDPKDVCIGHSYFIYKKNDEENKKIKIEYEVLPILKEYLKDGVLNSEAKAIINELL